MTKLPKDVEERFDKMQDSLSEQISAFVLKDGSNIRLLYEVFSTFKQFLAEELERVKK